MDGQNRDEMNEMTSWRGSADRRELHRERQSFPLLRTAALELGPSWDAVDLIYE